jgi:hypothetical protein
MEQILKKHFELKYINAYGILDFNKLNKDLMNNNYNKSYNKELIKFKIRSIRL